MKLKGNNMVNKILTIGFLISIMSNLYPGVLNQLYKGRPWEFLEDTFIIRPESQLSNLSGRSICWGIPALAGLSSLYVANKLTTPKQETDSWLLEPESEPINPKIRALLVSGTALLTGLISYKIVNNMYRNKVELRALEQFVASWPENKNYTPSQLHSFFDSLHRTYTTNMSSFYEEAEEVILAIKATIYDHFPTKYAKKDKQSKDFFTAKYFNSYLGCDLGSTLSGIANIITATKR